MSLEKSDCCMVVRFFSFFIKNMRYVNSSFPFLVEIT